MQMTMTRPERATAGLAARSAVNHHAGLAAEDIVARAYAARGCAEAARRWRGRGGEIDLILRDGDGIVFVEVKKSRTHAQAVQRVSRRQMTGSAWRRRNT